MTDTTNGKQYVGQHHYDKEELDPRYHGSGRIIRRIYTKRPETIKEEYLKTCYSQSEMDEWEKYFIFSNNTLHPNGYNLEEGGCGGIPSEETRRKMSEAARGKHPSEEARRKMSEAKIGKTAHNKGKHPSEETRRKLSESHKGHIPKNKGVKFTEEQRKRSSEAHMGQIAWNRKKVLQYTLDGDFVREWSSMSEAVECNGFNSGHISDCCLGKRKSHKGYIWKYREVI